MTLVRKKTKILYLVSSPRFLMQSIIFFIRKSNWLMNSSSAQLKIRKAILFMA